MHPHYGLSGISILFAVSVLKTTLYYHSEVEQVDLFFFLTLVFVSLKLWYHDNSNPHTYQCRQSFSFCCICWNACGPPAPEKVKERNKVTPKPVQHSLLSDNARKQFRAASLTFLLSTGWNIFLRLIIPFSLQWLISEKQRLDWRF